MVAVKGPALSPPHLADSIEAILQIEKKDTVNGGISWERTRQLREQLYAARPKCWVARDWFRVARPRLYAMAKEAAENDLVSLTFDGEVLRFAAPHAAVIVPVTGESWPDRYAIKAVELDAVPKRVQADPVQVMVWEDRLAIDRRTWPLLGQDETSVSPN